MLSRFLPTSRPAILYAALLLLFVAMVFGGASRLEIAGAIVVRLTALGLLVWLLWRQPRSPLQIDRHAAILWGAIALLLLLQLAPLPYDWWRMLPGREPAVAVLDAVGPPGMLAFSLTPDRTLDTLLSLLVPFIAFVLGSQLDSAGRSHLLKGVILIAAVGALIGLLQVAGGPDSALYFYRITNSDVAVGFFSNANHHANFLCIAIVFTFQWLASVSGRGVSSGPALGTALLVALFGVTILAAGSRAGVLLMMVSLAGGVALLPIRRLGLSPLRVTIAGAVLVALVGFVVAMEFSGRGWLGDRLAFSGGEEERWRIIPLFATIARDFAPLGTGFGSFDAVYRSYEPFSSLAFGYLNQAHNDYAQLAIEGGLPALAILGGFILWWIRGSWSAWKRRDKDRDIRLQRQAASLAILIVMIHSFGDYPLRSEAYMTLFAFACALLLPPAAAGRPQRPIPDDRGSSRTPDLQR